MLKFFNLNYRKGETNSFRPKNNLDRHNVPAQHGKHIYMGGTSQDVKSLKRWDFYPLYFGFS